MIALAEAASKDCPPSRTEPIDSTASAAGRRVALIHGDPARREALAHALSASGVDVVVAECLAEAAACQFGQADLLVVDLQTTLGGEPGRLASVRACCSSPIVVLTDNSADSVALALSAGADDVVRLVPGEPYAELSARVSRQLLLRASAKRPMETEELRSTTDAAAAEAKDLERAARPSAPAPSASVSTGPEETLELSQSKEFLEQLIDSSVDAIVSADMLGRILLFNRAAERVYGLPASEVIGTSAERLYPPGVAQHIMALILSEAHGGRGRLESYRCDFLSCRGDAVPIALSAALITRGDRPIGTVSIFTDLRDRMRMEQRLAQAHEQLRSQEKQTIVAELAGAAAHELNQPLTSVMGYAELVRRRVEPGTPLHQAAEIIRSEAERMAEIVRKIGKITRYETKSYVGTARILDLERASRSDDAPANLPPGNPSKGRSEA